MNFFAYYDIPMSLAPDRADLRRRFYAKSREVHPDQATDSEQAAAINNEAFRVLSDDKTLIKHILTIHGVHSLDDEKLPQEFLLDMMEINEAIMEAETPEATQALIEHVSALELDIEQELASFRQKWPESGTELEEALQLLKDYSIKSRYLLRIRENLGKFAPDL
jgi:molecular chaperone HscB